MNTKLRRENACFCSVLQYLKFHQQSTFFSRHRQSIQNMQNYKWVSLTVEEKDRLSVSNLTLESAQGTCQKSVQIDQHMFFFD